MTSIERISVDQMDAWTLIQIADSVLAPRCYPVVAPVGQSQIAILGGYDGNEYVCDAVVFDIESETCEKVVEANAAFAFYCFGNQSVSRPQEASLIALVKSKTSKPQMIAFDASRCQLYVLNEFSDF